MSSDPPDPGQARTQNIDRYRWLLKTKLTETERRFIQRRISEEYSARQTSTEEFVARSNIDHFLEALRNDELPPDKRSVITRLLIEEEDKLGRNLEQLQFAEDRVFAGRKRLENIRNKLNDPEADPASLSRASRLYATMEQTQQLLEDFCERLRENIVYRE